MKALLFFILLTITLNAQVTPPSYNSPPEWSNVLSFGGNALESVIEMKKDDSGNLYVLGYFYGETTIQSHTVQSRGSISDIFLAKFNSEGTLQWITHSDSLNEGSALGYQLLLHNESIYILGRFTSGDKLSNQTLLGNDSHNYFIAKYNSLGKLSNYSILEKEDGLNSSPPPEPRFTLNTTNNDIYVSILNKIYCIKSDFNTINTSKILDNEISISDITYLDNTIFITGRITNDVYIDNIYLDFTGSSQSLFYASLNIEMSANWAYTTRHSNNNSSLSGNGKFVIKDEKLFLLGNLNSEGSLNNQNFEELYESTGFLFVSNIRLTNGHIDSYSAFYYDIQGIQNIFFTIAPQQDKESKSISFTWTNGRRSFLCRYKYDNDQQTCLLYTSDAADD